MRAAAGGGRAARGTRPLRPVLRRAGTKAERIKEKRKKGFEAWFTANCPLNLDVCCRDPTNAAESTETSRFFEARICFQGVEKDDSTPVAAPLPQLRFPIEFPRDQLARQGT